MLTIERVRRNASFPRSWRWFVDASCSAFLIASSVALLSGATVLGTKAFRGAPDGIPVTITPDDGDSASAPPRIVQLGPGRFRVDSDVPTRELSVVVYLSRPSATKSGVLMMRSVPNGVEPHVRVCGVFQGQDWRPVAETNVSGVSRLLIPFDDAPRLRAIRMTLSTPTPRPARSFGLEEFGLFASAAGLSKDDRRFFGSVDDVAFYKSMLPRALRWIAIGGLLCVFLLGRRHRHFESTAFLLALAAALSVLLVWCGHFSEFGGRDLRAFGSAVAAEGVGSNLNYGLYMGSNLVKGHGPVLAPASPPWHRMPGYALVCAIGVLLARDPDNILMVSVWIVFVQIALFSAAVAFFYVFARRIMHPAVAALAALLAIFAPSQISFTQIESIMPAVTLYAAGCACIFLSRENMTAVRYDWLLHSAFAVWLLMRPDVLPAWLIVSVLLYWREPRRLLIPLVLFLAIGVSWGAYKRQYTHEFVMTTSSFGASAMVGLWEVPNKFKWELSDGSYFDWVRRVVPDPASAAANAYAMKEVLRFYLTYPFYVLSVAWHGFMMFVDLESWPGMYGFPLLPFSLRGRFVWLLLTIIALSLVVRYKATQSLLLGWPVLLNAPLFFLVYSSAGRFYNTASIAMALAAVPLLFDPQFYRALNSRRTATTLVLVMMFAVATWGAVIDARLIAADKLRYWSPFLDPARSSLSVFRQ